MRPMTMLMMVALVGMDRMVGVRLTHGVLSCVMESLYLLAKL